MRNKVTLVCGPPGSGKSTYVKEHMKAGDLVLDLDNIYEALSWQPFRSKSDSLLPYVLEVRRCITKMLATDTPTPIRAWVITMGDFNEARHELASSLGADVVVLRASVDECSSRMKAQGRPRSHVEEMVEIARRWHRSFVPAQGETIVEPITQYDANGWPT